jgi:DNA-binding NarL/FixJ family response regulator
MRQLVDEQFGAGNLSMPSTGAVAPPPPTRFALFERKSGSVIRILLIDPRPLTATAVQHFLEEADGHDDLTRFEVTAVSSPGQVPVDQTFDLLLLHVSPVTEVITEVERCLADIPAVHRKVPPVVFSDNGTPGDIAAAIRAGARGYLPSRLDSGKIVAALRLLASGLAILPPAALLRLAGHNGIDPGREGGATERDSPFTTRERTVLRRLQDGKPNKSIARELGLSESTVKVHVRSVFRKLGVQNRTEAALAAGQVLLGRTDDA